MISGLPKVLKCLQDIITPLTADSTSYRFGLSGLFLISIKKESIWSLKVSIDSFSWYFKNASATSHEVMPLAKIYFFPSRESLEDRKILVIYCLR